nr:hypothetical protein [Maliibacterium massiliense]
MQCPKCGTADCQILTVTDMKTKGYGGIKGCCGYLLWGPIGLLCGLCGMGNTRSVTRHYWVCPHCGHRFRA